jgi:hypothetical protein
MGHPELPACQVGGLGELARRSNQTRLTVECSLGLGNITMLVPMPMQPADLLDDNGDRDMSLIKPVPIRSTPWIV